MKALFYSPMHNTVWITNLLLKRLNVSVNKHTVQNLLEEHPEYPSLLSISDVLKDFKVENQAYLIKKEDYNVDDLLFPFIAYFPEGEGSFSLVHSIQSGLVEVSEDKKGRIKISEKDFLERWQGVALYGEASSASIEKSYTKNRLKYFLNNITKPLCLVLIFICFYFALSSHPFDTGYLILSVVKLMGLLVSVLLLIQSINSNNPFIQNLCNLGGSGGCNAILKSDAARITSWLSWSEVGFFYFSSTLALLLFSPSSIILLKWINLFSLPYIVYSISYQYRHKNWCILCCGIQMILFVEALTFSQYFPGFEDGNMRFQDLLVPGVLCISIPVLFWAAIKPFVLKAEQLGPLKEQLKKFKYNSLLFNQALVNQPRYKIGEELMPITLGNPDAQTVITMVSNPFCGPCAKAHELLDDWLKIRSDIQLKVIFSTRDQDDDEKTMVARHLSALSLIKDEHTIENALNDWYKQSHKEYEQWAKKYPVDFSSNVSEATKNQKQWCEIADIASTPTILINGYKLPKPYQLTDIKYLIN